MNEVRLIDANALKYKNLAEVNGKLTHVLTAEEINNAPTFPYITKEKLSVAYDQGFEDGQKRPQGEWIDYSDDGYVECPFCGSATTCEDNKDELHYCWNCGAKMKQA